MKQLIQKYFLPWRLYTLLVAMVAVLVSPVNQNFTRLRPGHDLPNTLYSWANFDGLHYLEIAEFGYGSMRTQFTEAFFPLYPLLIRQLAGIVGSYLASGLIISHLSLIGALVVLRKLIRIDFKSNMVSTCFWTLLMFPTAFFFFSVYNESLFLLLVVSVFYLARRQHFLAASVLAALASATRLVGFFLLPVLLWEFWQANGKNWRASISLNGLVPFISTSGLFLYMHYLWQATGDPLFFANLQPLVGAERVVTKVILLHQVFYRYLKMMVFTDHATITFMVVLLEFFVGLVFLGLALASFRLRFSYGLFTLGAYLLPTLTGTFSSLPRYVLVLFPAFLTLAKLFIKHPNLRWTYFGLNLVAQTYFLALFASGNFIG